MAVFIVFVCLQDQAKKMKTIHRSILKKDEHFALSSRANTNHALPLWKACQEQNGNGGTLRGCAWLFICASTGGNRSSVTTMKLWVIKACLFRNQNLPLDRPLHLVAIISFSSPSHMLNSTHMWELHHNSVCMCVCVCVFYMPCYMVLLVIWKQKHTSVQSLFLIWYLGGDFKCETAYFDVSVPDRWAFALWLRMAASITFPSAFIPKLNERWVSEEWRWFLLWLLFFWGFGSAAASRLC